MDGWWVMIGLVIASLILDHAAAGIRSGLCHVADALRERERWGIRHD